MKDDFDENNCFNNYNENSILCNEESFPTYPGPGGKQINWKFLNSKKVLKNSNKDIYYETDGETTIITPTKQQYKCALKLDLIVDDDTVTNDKSKISKMSVSTTNNIQNHIQPYQQHQEQHDSTSGFHIGLYGWRKKCLFVLILILIILIIVNLALTIWILKVMEFSFDGMGQLKIVPGGIQLTGQTMILDTLRASVIRSRHGQPIILESSRNFSINTRDWQGKFENRLFLGHDKLEILAHGLKIIDTQGAVIFSADKNEVAIGAFSLRIDGEGGAIFRESVQTPVIKAEPGRELKFESSTRSLQMNAGQDIFIRSGAGNIDANCLNDVRFHSEAGNIRLDAANVLIPNLKTAQPPSIGTPQIHERTGTHKVYQLCACSNGKLFLAMSHSVCAGDESNICR